MQRVASIHIIYESWDFLHLCCSQTARLRFRFRTNTETAMLFTHYTTPQICVWNTICYIHIFDIYLIYEDWDSEDPRRSLLCTTLCLVSTAPSSGCAHAPKLHFCTKSAPALHQILTDNRRHHQLTGAHSFSSFIAPNFGCASGLKTSPTQTTRQDTCSTPTPLCTILIIVYQIYNTSQNFPDTSGSMCPRLSNKKSRPM